MRDVKLKIMSFIDFKLSAERYIQKRSYNG